MTCQELALILSWPKLDEMLRQRSCQPAATASFSLSIPVQHIDYSSHQGPGREKEILPR